MFSVLGINATEDGGNLVNVRQKESSLAEKEPVFTRGKCRSPSHGNIRGKRYGFPYQFRTISSETSRVVQYRRSRSRPNRTVGGRSRPYRTMYGFPPISCRTGADAANRSKLNHKPTSFDKTSPDVCWVIESRCFLSKGCRFGCFDSAPRVTKHRIKAAIGSHHKSSAQVVAPHFLRQVQRL